MEERDARQIAGLLHALELDLEVVVRKKADLVHLHDVLAERFVGLEKNIVVTRVLQIQIALQLYSRITTGRGLPFSFGLMLPAHTDRA